MRIGVPRTNDPAGIAAVDLPAEPVPAAQNPFRVYLARLAPGSRRTMAQALDQVAAIASGGQLAGEAMPWGALRYQHAQAIRAALQEAVSDRTGKPLGVASINKHLCALRGVLREAWRLGHLSAEHYHRAVDLEPVRGSSVLRGRALEPNEVAALFHVLQRDESPAGARDAAILALGIAGGGLRRQEIVTLALPRSLDQTNWVLTVDGKGSQTREVPVKNGAVDALRAWLAHRGDEPGPLFSPVLKNGRVQLGKMISAEAIYRICVRRAEQAQIPLFSPHDMRRTYISSLLDRGVDLSIVSKLAGHTSGPTITAKYDRRGERAKHAGAEAITVPYVFRS